MDFFSLQSSVHFSWLIISENSMQCPIEHNPYGTTLASCRVCLLTDAHAGNNLGEIMNLRQAEKKIRAQNQQWSHLAACLLSDA